jgi:N-acetylglutamate synthase-like GNAT family acetyltransferase
MTVRYSTDFPDIDSFYALYESTGWNDKNKKSKEQLFGAMKNSWYFVSVYADDRLIGCGRVVSDGYLHAYINEMIVLPDFQRKSIGKEILNRLLQKILESGIKDIQLFCAKEEFYLKNGFENRPDDAPGMQYKFFKSCMIT